jgi:hypothetical protein
LKGHRFSDITDIQGHMTTILKSIPEIFWAVETLTHSVYWCARRPLRRWQQPLVCK